MGAFKSNLSALEGNPSREEWRIFFEENKVVSIGLIKKQKHLKLKKELDLIQQKIDSEQSHFVVLVEYKDPNIYQDQRTLPAEESFMISPNEFLRFYEEYILTRNRTSCSFILKSME